MDFRSFVKEIKVIGEYLSKYLEDHIYKENHILYPMTLKVLDEEEWRKVKDKFDKIGYCCFTPEGID